MKFRLFLNVGYGLYLKLQDFVTVVMRSLEVVVSRQLSLLGLFGSFFADEFVEIFSVLEDDPCSSVFWQHCSGE